MSIAPIVGKFKKGVITDISVAIALGVTCGLLYYKFSYLPFMERTKYVYSKIREERKQI